MSAKIVVLTPVKNEEWILEQFLSVTSQFADLIIVADQGSTDDSRSICSKFSKVHLIRNESESYDEAGRQQLLIQTARQLVDGQRILLALDADELLAADSLNSPGWRTMLGAEPGTVLFFEKPNLYLSSEMCLRYSVDFAGGYVDDGFEHSPKKVHSIRIPTPKHAPRLSLPDVKFLHYALVRPQAQAAKMRMYSVIENVLGTKTLFERRRYYDSKANYELGGRLEQTDKAWFEGWERLGIDVRTIEDPGAYWQDRETAKHLREHGARKFWFDDIWAVDWNALSHVNGRQPIRPPPRILRHITNLTFRCLSLAATLKQRLTR
jgi:glycosyltransferase involved in cell wall biosynthesis